MRACVCVYVATVSPVTVTTPATGATPAEGRVPPTLISIHESPSPPPLLPASLPFVRHLSHGRLTYSPAPYTLCVRKTAADAVALSVFRSRTGASPLLYPTARPLLVCHRTDARGRPPENTNLLASTTRPATATGRRPKTVTLARALRLTRKFDRPAADTTATFRIRRVDAPAGSLIGREQVVRTTGLSAVCRSLESSCLRVRCKLESF